MTMTEKHDTPIKRRRLQVKPRAAERRLRRRKGPDHLTQAEAAARCAMTQPQWCALETRKHPRPTVATYARVAQALKCKIDDLVDGVTMLNEDKRAAVAEFVEDRLTAQREQSAGKRN